MLDGRGCLDPSVLHISETGKIPYDELEIYDGLQDQELLQAGELRRAQIILDNSYPMFTMSSREFVRKVESCSTCLRDHDHDQNSASSLQSPTSSSGQRAVQASTFLTSAEEGRAAMTAPQRATLASSVPVPKASSRTTRSTSKQIQKQQEKVGESSTSVRSTAGNQPLTKRKLGVPKEEAPGQVDHTAERKTEDAAVRRHR
jgi:hypothetical protein